MTSNHPSLLNRFHLLFLIMGDVTIFILTLLLAIGVRFGFPITPHAWELHRGPFFWVLVIFLLCLTIGDWYDTRRRFVSHEFFGKAIVIFLLFLFLTFTLFYFSPFFIITPKRALLLQAVFLFIGFSFFRIAMMRSLHPGPVRWMMVGDHPLMNELLSEQHRLNKGNDYHLLHPQAITPELLSELQCERVVTANETIEHDNAGFFFRELLPRKIRIQRFTDFFEEVCEKVPVEVITETWFLENLDETRFLFYDRFKRISDVLFVFLLTLPAAILSLFLALAIKLEGKSDVLYYQRRLKKAGEEFFIGKFSSMQRNAESRGPQWSSELDSRVTIMGRFLRRTHLDEIPQLIPILLGDMSFIGPRPERPEFVDMLKEKIPFYYQRFLVKPGISGWAQIHYPYGSTVEDALKKLQYELYYIKHRTVLLDLEILLRTFRLMFSQLHR